MLDIALVNFVGAGLTAFAPVHNLTPPKTAAPKAVELLRILHQADADHTAGFVESASRAIWSDWLASGMPNAVAIAHLEKLPGIIEVHQPDKDLVVAAFAMTAHKPDMLQGAIEAQARKLSADVVERAREQDAIKDGELSDSVTFFLLETLFRQLLLNRSTVDRARPAMLRFFNSILVSDEVVNQAIEHNAPRVSLPDADPADTPASEAGLDLENATTATDRDAESKPPEGDADESEAAVAPEFVALAPSDDVAPDLEAPGFDATECQQAATGSDQQAITAPKDTGDDARSFAKAEQAAAPATEIDGAILAQPNDADDENATPAEDMTTFDAVSDPAFVGSASEPIDEPVAETPIAPVSIDTSRVEESAERTVQIVLRDLPSRLGHSTPQSADVEEAKAVYTSLVTEIAEAQAPNQDIRDILVQAADHLQDGELLETDTDLAAAEPICPSGEDADQQSGALSAARIRGWRGKLQQLQFEFRRAAKHFAVAVRLSPRDDYEQRWKYIELQAQALIRHDHFFNDMAALEEAAKTCTEIVAVLHDDRTKTCRAHAKALLGQLLATMGERDLDNERLSAAIDHLREAIEYFEAKPARRPLAVARYNLARGLATHGEEIQEPEVLEEAVRIYQALHASLEDLGGSPHPDAVDTRLGLALAGLGRLTHNQDVLNVAVDTLRASLASMQASTIDDRGQRILQGRANAAMARTLIELARLDGNEEPVREAGPLYRLALTALRDAEDFKQAERLEQEMAAIGEPVPSARSKSPRKADAKPKFAPAPAPRGRFSKSQEPPQPSETEESAGGGYLSRLRASLRLPGTSEDNQSAAKPQSGRRSA